MHTQSRRALATSLVSTQRFAGISAFGTLPVVVAMLASQPIAAAPKAATHFTCCSLSFGFLKAKH